MTITDLIDSLEHDINCVEQNRAASTRGGQHVGTGGALSNAPPSVLAYLLRFVRDLRDANGEGQR